jgi:hypothetical protein
MSATVLRMPPRRQPAAQAISFADELRALADRIDAGQVVGCSIITTSARGEVTDMHWPPGDPLVLS